MKKTILVLLVVLVLILVGVAVWGRRSEPVDNLPRVTYPQANQVIESPLTVKGEAPGNWFFEATLPVRLLDADGKQIAFVPAQAKDDWMTTSLVPFEVTLSFGPVEALSGTLVIAKDNPSGLPENNAQITVPIKFVR